MHFYKPQHKHARFFGLCVHKRSREILMALFGAWIIPLVIVLVVEVGYLVKEPSTSLSLLVNPVRAAETLPEIEDKEIIMEGRNIPPTAVQSPVARQIVAIALEEEFPWPDYLVRLAYCESTLNPQAVGDMNIYTKSGQVVRSRGAFQISEAYHPNVSDEFAFDLEQSAKWTMWQIESGNQHLWSCDEKVKHQQY